MRSATADQSSSPRLRSRTVTAIKLAVAASIERIKITQRFGSSRRASSRSRSGRAVATCDAVHPRKKPTATIQDTAARTAALQFSGRAEKSKTPAAAHSHHRCSARVVLKPILRAGISNPLASAIAPTSRNSGLRCYQCRSCDELGVVFLMADSRLRKRLLLIDPGQRAIHSGPPVLGTPSRRQVDHPVLQAVLPPGSNVPLLHSSAAGDCRDAA